MTKLQVGEPAPLFTLFNQHEQSISLKNYLKKGPVLLYFYPKAMTPGCTVQACDIRDNQKFFKENKYSILAISPDPINKLSKFAEDNLLDFDMLSDAECKVAKKYDVWGEKSFMGKTYMGVNRVSFIINQDGIITKILENFKPKQHSDLVSEYILAEN